jgi:hypothetical protein
VKVTVVSLAASSIRSLKFAEPRRQQLSGLSNLCRLLAGLHVTCCLALIEAMPADFKASPVTEAWLLVARTPRSKTATCDDRAATKGTLVFHF